jgi:hypothetical protein
LENLFTTICPVSSYWHQAKKFLGIFISRWENKKYKEQIPGQAGKDV